MPEVVKFPASQSEAVAESAPPTVSVVKKLTIPDDQLKIVDDYAAAAISGALARKASLETRGLALVALNTAIATLFLAVQSRAVPVFDRTAVVLILVAILFSVASLTISVIAALPAHYEVASAGQLRRLMQEASDPAFPFTRMNVIGGRIREYSDLTKRIVMKARLISIAFGLAGAFALSLLLLVVLARYGSLIRIG